MDGGRTVFRFCGWARKGCGGSSTIEASGVAGMVGVSPKFGLSLKMDQRNEVVWCAAVAAAAVVASSNNDTYRKQASNSRSGFSS